MPCSDGRDSGSYPVENPINIEMKQRLNVYARLLCHACSLLEANRIRMGAELTSWYGEHKAEDERQAKVAKVRLDRETKAQKRKQYLADVKKRLLNQLDPDEREALGL